MWSQLGYNVGISFTTMQDLCESDEIDASSFLWSYFVQWSKTSWIPSTLNMYVIYIDVRFGTDKLYPQSPESARQHYPGASAMFRPSHIWIEVKTSKTYQKNLWKTMENHIVPQTFRRVKVRGNFFSTRGLKHTYNAAPCLQWSHVLMEGHHADAAISSQVLQRLAKKFGAAPSKDCCLGEAWPSVTDSVEGCQAVFFLAMPRR